MSMGSSLLLRPALEAAMVVARAGETANPVQPAPAKLRPYLSFARLPGPALEVARRVLDDDDAFRERVAAATSAAELGQAAWLWLTRPDGWERELDRLKREAQELESVAREEKADRDARRRLARAEDAARRAEATITARQREAETARAEAATERAGRQAAEAEVAQLRTHLPTLRDERNRAIRKMKELETELANRAADLRHARHQLRMMEAEMAQAVVPPAPPASPAVPSQPAQSAPAVVSDSFDRERIAAAVGVAAEAANQLSTALAEAAALLAPAPAAPAPQPRERGPAPPSRQSRPLPPGVFDDSVAAAEHLAGLAGAVVVVDGYNVSQTAWPGVSIADQRSRLVDACAELHAAHRRRGRPGLRRGRRPPAPHAQRPGRCPGPVLARGRRSRRRGDPSRRRVPPQPSRPGRVERPPGPGGRPPPRGQRGVCRPAPRPTPQVDPASGGRRHVTDPRGRYRRNGTVAAPSRVGAIGSACVQKLHLVGFTTDRRGLIFSARRGAKSGGFVIHLDDNVRAAVEEAWVRMAEAGDDEPVDELNRQRPESALSVRDVQARLRAGRSIEEVAAEAHMEPAWVARFAAPVVAEQAQMVAAVRASYLERARAGPSDLPVGEAVYRNLAERGVARVGDELDHNWAARQLADGLWLVTFRYQSRGKWQTATWEYDERADIVRARDRLGSQLAYRAPRTPAGGTARSAPARRRPPGRKVSSARKVAATRMAAAAKKSAVRDTAAARKAAEVRTAAAKKAADDKAREAAKKAAEREKAKLARERARVAAKKAADREKARRAREKAEAAKAVPPAPAPVKKKATPASKPRLVRKKAVPPRPPAPAPSTARTPRPPVLAAEAAPDGPKVRPERVEAAPEVAPKPERRRPLQVRRSLELPAPDDSEIDALLEEAAGTPSTEAVERPRFGDGVTRAAAEPDDNGQEPPPAVSVRPRAVAVPVAETPRRRAPLRAR